MDAGIRRDGGGRAEARPPGDARMAGPAPPAPCRGCVSACENERSPGSSILCWKDRIRYVHLLTFELACDGLVTHEMSSDQAWDAPSQCKKMESGALVRFGEGRHLSSSTADRYGTLGAVRAPGRNRQAWLPPRPVTWR